MCADDHKTAGFAGIIPVCVVFDGVCFTFTRVSRRQLHSALMKNTSRQPCYALNSTESFKICTLSLRKCAV